MLAAMDVARNFSDDTKIFCGHEYTKANMEFCMKAEGISNKKIGEAE